MMDGDQLKSEKEREQKYESGILQMARIIGNQALLGKKNFETENYHDIIQRDKITSINDIIANPDLLIGHSKADVAALLDETWTEGVYGGSGWKFVKDDQSIFYHPGGGIHVGSYYGCSSAQQGKHKFVSRDTYHPIDGDKATVHYDK